MNWDKEKYDWPHYKLSSFVYSQPHTWHIQDTSLVTKNKNLPIILCKFPINSSRFGGSLLDPEPLLSPLLGPPEPQGDWLKKFFVKDMRLYIVTFIAKTS